MADKVEIKGDCPERVAFDLMDRIATREYNESMKQKATERDYWLDLYLECHEVVLHGNRRERTD